MGSTPRLRIASFGALLLLVGSLPGCATLSQSEIKFLETRELGLGYDEAYRAAANGLFSLGYAISHSDKASGILGARARHARGQVERDVSVDSAHGHDL